MYTMCIRWRDELTGWTQKSIMVFNDFTGKINDPRTLNGLMSVASNTTWQNVDTMALRVLWPSLGLPVCLIKGNCVLMLFGTSVLRGFLQSHFIKHKACSELFQGAFVIGAHPRSSSESVPTKWDAKYLKRVTTPRRIPTPRGGLSSWIHTPRCYPRLSFPPDKERSPRYDICLVADSTTWNTRASHINCLMIKATH